MINEDRKTKQQQPFLNITNININNNLNNNIKTSNQSNNNIFEQSDNELSKASAIDKS